MPPRSSPASPVDGVTDTWGRRSRKRPNAICAECGCSFHPRHADSKYCSRPCAWANNGGHNKKPEYWGLHPSGYVIGKKWSNGVRKHVRKHRVIMEEHLGRPLRPDEDVHHINGDKADNRIENLQVLSHSEHSRLTNQEMPYSPRGRRLNLSPEERQRRRAWMKSVHEARTALSLANPSPIDRGV